MANNHPPDQPGRILPSTLLLLTQELEKKYPGRWQLAVEVVPKAVIKTIDNQMDAIETVSRCMDINIVEAATLSSELEKELKAIDEKFQIPKIDEGGPFGKRDT